jgi:hypothetical protein
MVEKRNRRPVTQLDSGIPKLLCTGPMFSEAVAQLENGVNGWLPVELLAHVNSYHINWCPTTATYPILALRCKSIADIGDLRQRTLVC